MESSTNRFTDSEDQPIDGRDVKQLLANCEKWSLKNDLELLSHLKQLSNDLITKTENTSHSIDSLVFEAKMNTVRVDNVINEFQMLANCQFVENRVYDEEMEDVVTNGPTIVSTEPLISTKSKDEHILPKIKSALTIGLDFLNQRFDCVSKSVLQNDSDDENDSIVEGLVSDSSRDEYSQRLLPYIIGSDDFIKDNFVGLSSVEESPVIDLKTRIENDIQSDVKSVVSVESDSDTFAVRKTTSNANNLIKDKNDSEEEEESTDIFSAIITQSATNNEKHVSSDESDFDEPNEDNLFEPTDNTIESDPKSIIRSFNDELSAAISAKNPNKGLSVGEEQQTKSVFTDNKSRTETSKRIDLDSDSSDENDSIFKITKTKPKTQIKQKTNFSNLFDETNDNSLFGQKSDKSDTKVEIKKVLPNSDEKKVFTKTSGLFEDEDEDDDLFGAIVAKKTETKRPIVRNEEEKTNVFNRSVSKIEKPIVETKSIFDDEDEDDDIFSGIASKTNPNKVQNSDAFEPVVIPKESPNLVKELSSALKKKSLYQNSESESNSDDNKDLDKNDIFSEVKTVLDSNEKVWNQSIAVNNNVEDIKEDILNEDITSEVLAPKEEVSTDSKVSENDFLDKPTVPLSNDGLKHRAQLGSQRNRRPPSKRVLKLTPIIDFNKDLKPKTDNSLVAEEKCAPIAATRTLKITNQLMTNNIDKTVNNFESTDNWSTDEQRTKHLNSLVKSPSTEEEDIFPTQANSSKNSNISEIFAKSKTSSISVFNDFDDIDDSLFSSGKAFKRDDSQRVVDKTGLFDTSDSEDEKFISNITSKSDTNIISNLIKPSNSDLFNHISSSDSSLSTKSELKTENSKQTLSLFSDSDDDLFSLVNKTKSVKTEPISQTNKQIKKLDKRTEKSKIRNSFLSDSDDETSDLFKRNEEIKERKPKVKANAKPIFDFDDNDDDIFAPKGPKANASKPLVSSKTKPKTLSESSDLFDDPLFASRH